MIILDNTVVKLQALLGATVSTTAFDCSVYFYDIPNKLKDDYGEYRGAAKYTNVSSATAVDICAAPLVVGYIRDVQNITIYNADAVSTAVSVRRNDATTTTILKKHILMSTQSLVYEHGAGWQVL